MAFTHLFTLVFYDFASSVLKRCISTQLRSLQHITQPPPLISTWIYQQKDSIGTPVVTNNLKVIFPESSNGIIKIPSLIENIQNSGISLPALNNNAPMEAARLIVIRRKKMKKHKLRKLRNRMKFEWAKLRQKRELRKEKLFQAGLVQKCKEAEAFSADAYLQEKLNKLNEVVIPRYWKGKRLPEFLIREKMGLPPK